MKKIALLVLCCSWLLSASAQYNIARNNIWAFGYHAGLDFSLGTPVSFSSSIYAHEGCASVCNSVGQLLFYTDGDTVYNRLGVAMPAGVNIVPFSTLSTTQAAVIVPVLNDTNKFYIFSLESSSSMRLAYSIVDMTLDGGLGDMVPGSTGVIFESGMSEKMFAVAGDNCNIWLVTHKSATTQFYAYSITSSGISTTPVVSSVGSFTVPNTYTMGVMKCSPDRHKIVSISAGGPSATQSGIELFDFDPATGIVSNCQLLESWPPGGCYGAEFSPDNTKLYTPTAVGVINVYQWDISLPTTAAIIATKTAISSGGCSGSDLKLAPDGKIYANSNSSTDLDRIDFPNVAGPACSYVSNAVNVSPGSLGVGLPNVVWYPVNAVPGIIIGKLSLCKAFSTSLNCTPSGGSWSSGSSNATVTSSGLVTGIAVGTAMITYSMPGGCFSTAIVSVNPLPAPITGPTTVTTGSTTTLTSVTPGGAWSSGDSTRAQPGTTGVITGVAPGTATIYYTLPTGCKQSVVITVVQKNKVFVNSAILTKPNLYPNPATNEIVIEAEQNVFTSFLIYNAVGQEITTQHINGTETKVNVKAYPPGEYQVIFMSNGIREMTRFTKW